MFSREKKNLGNLRVKKSFHLRWDMNEPQYLDSIHYKWYKVISQNIYTLSFFKKNSVCKQLHYPVIHFVVPLSKCIGKLFNSSPKKWSVTALLTDRQTLIKIYQVWYTCCVQFSICGRADSQIQSKLLYFQETPFTVLCCLSYITRVELQEKGKFVLWILLHDCNGNQCFILQEDSHFEPLGIWRHKNRIK